jgi:hypothetical protein
MYFTLLQVLDRVGRHFTVEVLALIATNGGLSVPHEAAQSPSLFFGSSNFVLRRRILVLVLGCQASWVVG